MSLLQLEKVTLKYPHAAQPVLQQISYEVKQGDFVILLGSNGSGKSSLLKILHRDLVPNAGRIFFQNKPIAQFPGNEFGEKVAVLSQNTADSLFSSLSIYENYLLIKKHRHLDFTHHATEKTFLKEYLLAYNPNLSDKLDVLVQQLSGGERQALALAFCLLQPPALLLLDEHTSALDPKTSEQIMLLTQKMIEQYHITCILTTHDLDIALRFGNRILMLHEGKVRQTFNEADKRSLTRESLIANYY